MMIATTTRLALLVAATAAATAAIVSATSLRSVEDVSRHLEVMEYQAAMSAPLYCYIENGFDFVGNDLKNVPGATPDSCCWQCFATNGCKAYSWTNQNGGTCWLKSARGEIVKNANVKSSLLLVGTQYRVCELMENTDFVGNDIGKAKAAKAELCCDICHNYAGCRAYAWTNQDGGTCWLKSKGGQPVAKSGVRAAEAYPVEPNKCSFDRDVDFPGFDIGNVPSASHTGCCKACENKQGCRAWTWSNFNGGTCWLKSLGGNYVKKVGAISGVYQMNPQVNCTMEWNVDYVGNDIGKAKATYSSLCAPICKEYDGCKAFSWSNYEGGTCWLKSGKNETIAAQGVDSCVLA